MDFDLTWILLGLPLAFGLGWAASRLDLRQLRMANRQAPKAYFKGLNFLLNEQQDQAIDAFIEAVQNDPDTSELHFALGNLFRRRGEFERAVRVHQHLLSRGDLDDADRARAQHALALDFQKAGLIDRAEDALRKLEGTRFESQARLALLALYERSREWPRAAEVARKLEAAGEGSFTGRLAHYACEQAQTQAAAGDAQGARHSLEQAVQEAPQTMRPRLQLAALLRAQGQELPAFQTLSALLLAAPASAPLAALPLAQSAQACGHSVQALALLEQSYQTAPALDVLEAMVLLQSDQQAGGLDPRDGYIRHLEREPSLIAAARWLSHEKLEHEQFHPLVQRALDHATRPLNRYRCAACGFEAKTYFWQCPGCQTWDSYPARRVEEL